MKSKYQKNRKANAYFADIYLQMSLRGLSLLAILAIFFAAILTGTIGYLLVLVVVVAVIVALVLTRKLKNIKKKLAASGRIGSNALVYSCSPLYSFRTHTMIVDSEKITIWDWHENLLLEIPNKEIASLEWGSGPQLTQVRLLTAEKPIAFQLTKREYDTRLGFKPKAKGEKIALGFGAAGNVLGGPNIGAAGVSVIGALQAVSGLAQLCELANIKKYSQIEKLNDKTGRITLITIGLTAVVLLSWGYLFFEVLGYGK